MKGSEDHEKYLEDKGVINMGIIVLHHSLDFLSECESHFMERIQSKKDARYFCLLIVKHM